jgi:hypothetical protein
MRVRNSMMMRWRKMLLTWSASSALRDMTLMIRSQWLPLAAKRSCAFSALLKLILI